MKPNKKYATPSLTRAIEVIELLNKHSGWVPSGVIRQTLGLPESSTHAILNSLLQNGIIHCDPGSGAYKLGNKLLAIGQKALFQSLEGTLFEEARKSVAQISRKHDVSSFFGYMNENDEAAYIARSTQLHNKLSIEAVGALVPPQTTAIGKVLLAWRDEKTVCQVINKTKPTDYTDRAILEPGKFLKHLKKMRRHGFVLADREAVNNSVCVAAPVFIKGKDAPIGGISIVSNFEQMHFGFFNRASESVYCAAKNLSAKYGATDYPEYSPMSCPK